MIDQNSPWALPKLELPTKPAKPNKRGRYVKYNGVYPDLGRRTIRGLSKGSDERVAAMMAIPNRDSINNDKTLQRDRTDMFRRGGI
jgi:coproporphyrinogen III oxidase